MGPTGDMFLNVYPSVDEPIVHPSKTKNETGVKSPTDNEIWRDGRTRKSSLTWKSQPFVKLQQITDKEKERTSKCWAYNYNKE